MYQKFIDKLSKKKKMTCLLMKDFIGISSIPNSIWVLNLQNQIFASPVIILMKKICITKAAREKCRRRKEKGQKGSKTKFHTCFCKF